jgi:hypothetical protein
MPRDLLMGALVLCCLIGFSSISLAEEKPKESKPHEATPTEAKTSSSPADLRPTLDKMRKDHKLIQGKNTVVTAKAEGGSPAFTVFAMVDKDKITKWEAVDASGKQLKIKTGQDKAKATCTVCIETDAGGGKPMVEHCWQIDCKDLPSSKDTAVKAPM